MITALAQVLLLFAAFASISFVSYYFGVASEQQHTRRYAQRAHGNQRIAEILAEANAELKDALNLLEAGRDLTTREAREFERLIRKAGL